VATHYVSLAVASCFSELLARLWILVFFKLSCYIDIFVRHMNEETRNCALVELGYMYRLID